jgi:hypothetical protein
MNAERERVRSGTVNPAVAKSATMTAATKKTRKTRRRSGEIRLAAITGVTAAP